MIPPAKKNHAAPGTFSALEAYTFAEMRRRGFGATLLRSMQRKGMPVRVIGSQKIILGQELLNWFAQLPTN